MAAVTMLISRSKDRNARNVAVGPYAAQKDPCPTGTKQMLNKMTGNASARHTNRIEGLGINVQYSA